MPTQYREDQAVWSAKVGDINLGSADSKSGGSFGSEETTYFGPDGRQRQLGGRQTVENITLTYALTLDLWGKIPTLKGLRGRPDAASLSWVPKNADGLAEGTPQTVSGLLVEVNDPDYGADSDDVGMLELVFAVNA